MASMTWLAMGMMPELQMVTALRGCRSWTRWRAPLFFFMQNQWEQYNTLECLYTPAVDLSLKILITLCKMPAGIGRFLWAQGICSIMGILTGEKYSSLNHPFSSSVQAKPISFTLST